MEITEELKKFIKFRSKLEKQIQSAPIGTLILSKSKTGIQYYMSIPGEKRKYLSKKDYKLISELAQKYYNIKASEFLDKQISCMMEFDKTFDPKALQEIFLELPEELQKMVVPCEMTDEQYIQWWKNIPYMRNPYEFKFVFTTMNGEKVRSKSEALIADRLKAYGIPYKYECPLCIGGKTIYPDFTILNINTRQEVYFEHFGMMDKPLYVEKFLNRMDLYHENEIIDGINLFYTFETEEIPFDLNALNSLIKHIASIVK